MSEKRRALGRGLGALIPTSPVGDGRSRPMDVFFRDNSAGRPGSTTTVSRETPLGRSDQTNGSSGGQVDGVLYGDSMSTAGTSFDDQTQADRDLAPVPGARYAEVSVLSIRPNPRQPRKVFDDDDMAELVNSIREVGVLQPVVVRPIPAEELDNSAGQGPDWAERPQFELIMGERRWRATQAAGLAFIPTIIKDTDDDDLLRDALLENLHRSQLNSLEEAAAYQQLLDDFGCTHDELATRIGRSRPQISNTLRLLKLPPVVQPKSSSSCWYAAASSNEFS